MNSKKILNGIWEYAVMTFAAFVYTVSWEAFMIPNGMSGGGLMGLCTVLEYATGGTIPASVSFFVSNTILILLAVLAFGIGFGFRTIYTIAVSAVFLAVIDGWSWTHSVPGNFFYVKETVLIPVIAGFFESIGIGLVIRHGGSTGGTDIIALMVNKYWPVSLGKVFLLSDLVVVCSILLLPDKTFNDMIYGLIEVVTFALTIDFITIGNKNRIQLLIFTEKYREIADFVCEKMGRGVTLLKAQGWFTKKSKDVLLLILTRQEMSTVSKELKSIDPRAFMSVSNVGEVYGEGFSEIKAGVPRIRRNKNNGSNQE